MKYHGATYCYEWHSSPTQPHIRVIKIGNPKMAQAFGTNPFAFTLAPEDLARLVTVGLRRRGFKVFGPP